MAAGWIQISTHLEPPISWNFLDSNEFCLKYTTEVIRSSNNLNQFCQYTHRKYTKREGSYQRNVHFQGYSETDASHRRVLLYERWKSIRIYNRNCLEYTCAHEYNFWVEQTPTDWFNLDVNFMERNLLSSNAVNAWL